MRTSWAIAALFAALCSAIAPQSAYADERPDHTPVLASCINAAQDEAALRACDGRITERCRADDDSTIGLTLCLSEEATAWGAQLDAVLARLYARESTRMDELKHAQTQWLPWLDAECSYRADAEQGGSGQQVDLALCYREYTADRAVRYILYERSLP